MTVAERIAYTTAALTLVGSVATTAVTVLSASDPPPALPGNSCNTLVKEYLDSATSNAGLRERLLLGEDNMSSLTDDPQAEFCKVTPAQLEAALKAIEAEEAAAPPTAIPGG